MTEPTFGQLLDYAGKATVLTLLAALLWGVMTRRWYPPWYVAELQQRIAKLEAENAKWSEFLTRIVEPIIPPRKP